MNDHTSVARLNHGEPSSLDPPGDGLVGVDDILGLIAAWGTPSGDLTGDGITGVDDVLVALDAWGSCGG